MYLYPFFWTKYKDMFFCDTDSNDSKLRNNQSETSQVYVVDMKSAHVHARAAKQL